MFGSPNPELPNGQNSLYTSALNVRALNSQTTTVSHNPNCFAQSVFIKKLIHITCCIT